MMKKNAPYSGARRKANEQVASDLGAAARTMRILPGGETAVNAVQKSKPQFRESAAPIETTTPAQAPQRAYTSRPEWENKYRNEPERPNKLKKQFRGQEGF